uniref:Uncharacterized protein n=1 Tax=Anguilla anguilla TaxID=7936 RepID=A0A0E9Q009_ANGAN
MDVCILQNGQKSIKCNYLLCAIITSGIHYYIRIILHPNSQYYEITY